MKQPVEIEDMRQNSEGITCPSCGESKLPVDYTRRKGGTVRRVRVCPKCGRRLPTVEKLLAS